MALSVKFTTARIRGLLPYSQTIGTITTLPTVYRTIFLTIFNLLPFSLF